MKQYINIHEFHRQFEQMRPNNFTWDGREALFQHLEEWESATDYVLEFDVIALCCDYTESGLGSVLKEYGLDTLEQLQENTNAFVVNPDPLIDSVIYQNY